MRVKGREKGAWVMCKMDSNIDKVLCLVCKIRERVIQGQYSLVVVVFEDGVKSRSGEWGADDC